MGNSNSSDNGNSGEGLNTYCWGVGFGDSYNEIDIMSSTPDYGDEYGQAFCTSRSDLAKSYGEGYEMGVRARGDSYVIGKSLLGRGVSAGSVVNVNFYPDGNPTSADSIKIINRLKKGKIPLNLIEHLTKNCEYNPDPRWRNGKCKHAETGTCPLWKSGIIGVKMKHQGTIIWNAIRPHVPEGSSIANNIDCCNFHSNR